MKRTKFIAVLSSFSLLGCLFSCTGNSTNNENNDLVRDENGSIVYNNVELNLWSVTTGDDAQTQDAIISNFNSLYEGMIHVNSKHISRYDLENQLSSTMTFDKKNAPDMLFTHGHRTNEYIQNEWIVPIEDYYTLSNTPLDKSDFASSLLETVSYQNKMYSTPIDVHSTMIEIRTDILAKNGLSIPSNYNELVDVCTKATELAEKGQLWIRGENSEGYASNEWRKATTADPYTPFPIGYGDMWVHEFLGYTAAYQNGGKFLENDGSGMPGWNTKEAADGLQVLRDWVFPSETSRNKYQLSMDYGSEYDVGIEPFRSGKSIFKLNGPWVYKTDLEVFSTMLREDGGDLNMTTRSLSNMLAKDTSKEYASKIKGEGHALMLMSTVESTTKRCASSIFADYMAYYSGIDWARRGHIPAVNSVSNSSEFKGDADYEKYIKYWGNSNDYVVYGPTQYYSYIDTYFKQAVQKSMSSQFKNKDIKGILDSEYKDCKAYISLYA